LDGQIPTNGIQKTKLGRISKIANKNYFDSNKKFADINIERLAILTNESNKDVDKNERSDIFLTYETMEKLLEAAHIIYINENTDDRPTKSKANEDNMKDMIILQPGLPAVRA
jgi:hypothetical protein